MQAAEVCTKTYEQPGQLITLPASLGSQADQADHSETSLPATSAQSQPCQITGQTRWMEFIHLFTCLDWDRLLASQTHGSNVAKINGISAVESRGREPAERGRAFSSQKNFDWLFGVAGS